MNTMNATIRGIYENGSLRFLEPVPNIEKAEVLITFLPEKRPADQVKKRVLGGLKHLGGSIPDDFNDPIDDLKEYM